MCYCSYRCVSWNAKKSCPQVNMFISDEASNNATFAYVALHGIVVNYGHFIE